MKGSPASQDAHKDQASGESTSKCPAYDELGFREEKRSYKRVSKYFGDLFASGSCNFHTRRNIWLHIK
jgi:hypothetical protein